MDVARGDAGDPQALGEAREPAVSRHVMAPERALELHPEAVAPEGAHQALAKRHRRGRVGAGGHAAGALEDPGEGAIASAAGEADEPFGVPLQETREATREEGHPAGRHFRAE